MEIAAIIGLLLVLVAFVVIGIVESVAYWKRYKAAQLRDETQARMNAKVLAILEAEYPEALACQFEYDSKL